MKIDSHKRSIIKTISWRLISVITTFIITYYYTKSATFAISISVTDTLIKFFLFYFHERSWAGVKWGRKKVKKKKKKKKNKDKLKNESE